MSGSLDQSVNSSVVTVTGLMKQIKASQERVLKSFNEHNQLVEKVMEQLQNVKDNIQLVKVKDPLDEIMKLSFDSQVNMVSRLNKLVDILSIYGNDKISTSFKKFFLGLFHTALNLKESVSNLEVIKKRILQVRDIRWILQEMEKYPKLFHFNEDDIELLQHIGASRDNIFLIKKILKKDGLYNEYYPDGELKLQFRMVEGELDGKYTVWYENGQIKEETTYSNGIQDNEWKVYYENGKLFVDGRINGENKQWYENGQLMNKYNRVDNRQEGDYIEYHENGKLWVKTSFKNNRVVGDYEMYDTNGKLFLKFYSLDGELKKDSKYFKVKGNLKEWDDQGKLIRDVNYDNNGFLHGKCMIKGTKSQWKHGILELSSADFYMEGIKQKCKIKENCLVLFYPNDFTEEEFSILRELLGTKTTIATCKQEECKKMDIILYYAGMQWLRYSGGYNAKDLREFLE